MGAFTLILASFFDKQGLICIVAVVIIAMLATSTRRPARRCSRCREINREQASFCAQCGTRLPGR